MCGIAAIYAFHSSAPPVDREELLRIRDHMAPRGPDAKGQWYSEDGQLGIGHRRLSIIDLSTQGVQPMLNARRNLVLSFNGEIYNYKALRALLDGEKSAYRNVVLMNAAAGLLVGGKADSLGDAAILAANAIDSGKAAEKLNLLIERTNG